MNTLPKAITANFFVDTIAYHSLGFHWAELMRSPHRRELTAAHHLIYLALLGKDWRRAFTPITNQRKLDNGAFYGWPLFRATALLHIPAREGELLAPFDGLVTSLMLQQLRQLIPIQRPYSYQPDQFTAADFPFEAYSVLEATPDA